MRTTTVTTRRAVAAALTLVLVGGLAACGDDTTAGSADTDAKGADPAAVHAHGSGTAAADDPGAAETMVMRRLGSASAGDRKVELDVSAPVTFAVHEGEGLVEHAPTKGQNAHVMLLLSDARSGDRLPDATVTLRIVDAAGKVVSSGPQYPMIGMGMGLHYGDNVSIPRRGRYVAQLVVGPPRIGRHADTTDRWNSTVRMSIPFAWDGGVR